MRHSAKKEIKLQINELHKHFIISFAKSLVEHATETLGYKSNNLNIDITSPDYSRFKFESLSDFESNFSSSTEIKRLEIYIHLSHNEKKDASDKAMISASINKNYKDPYYTCEISAISEDSIMNEDYLIKIESKLSNGGTTKSTDKTLKVEVTTSDDEREHKKEVSKSNEKFTQKQTIITCVIGIAGIILGALLNNLLSP